jgi:cyclohexanone monooxygenase
VVFPTKPCVLLPVRNRAHSPEAQYSVPAGDAPVSDEDRAKVLDNWDQVWRDVAGTATGFGFQESAVPLFSVPEEERQRRLEEVWQIGACFSTPCPVALISYSGGGFRFMFGAFCDVATDENAK